MAELTKEQKQIIRMIEKEAVAAGIDPDFAVALANLESSFKHIPAEDKKSTAYGPFQVNKATAEANGVDYDEMKKNPELAVKTGIMNILRHAKNPQFEGDPMRIAAAHRYGENSDYAKTGDPTKIDRTLAGYLASALEHFPKEEFPSTIYTVSKPQEAKEAEPESKDEQAPGMGSVPLGSSNPKEQAAILAEQEAQDRALAAAGAGATGALFGAVKVPTLKILHRLSQALPGSKVSVEDAAKLAEKVATGQIPAVPGTTPATAAPGAPAVPGAPKSVIRVDPTASPGSVISDAGYLAKGETGAQVYNTAKTLGFTDIEAADFVRTGRTAKDVYAEAEARRSAGFKRLESIFPTQKYLENPLYGGILTAEPSAGRGPRATYVSRPEIPPSPDLPQGRPAGLSQLPPTKPVASSIPPIPQFNMPVPQASPDAIQRGVRYVMGSSPVKYGLAGLGAGYNIEDAYQNLSKPDMINKAAGLSSLGAAGASGLTLVPKLAARANPAALGLTTASQVMGDIGRGDYQSAAESGLTGSVMLAPRLMGPLAAMFYSRGLNKGEEEELERRRKMAPTITRP